MMYDIIFLSTRINEILHSIEQGHGYRRATNILDLSGLVNNQETHDIIGQLQTQKVIVYIFCGVDEGARHSCLEELTQSERNRLEHLCSAMPEWDQMWERIEELNVFNFDGFFCIR